MKKINTHIREELKPMSLYLDDIEKLMEIFKEISNDITIEFDNYELENIHEIPTLNLESTKKLKITSRNPYISIDFSKSGIYLYADDDTIIQRGCIEKIKNLLSTRIRKYTYFYHGAWSGGFVGATIIPLYTSLEAGKINYIAIFSILLLFGLLWSYFGHKDQFNNYSIIYTKTRLASPNFFKRNQDSIIVAIIGALVGALIGIGGTLAINKFDSRINVSQDKNISK